MIRRWAAPAVTALAFAAPVSAMQAAAPPPLPVAPPPAVAPIARITNPDWVRMPTGIDLARLYPRRAQSQGLNGRTVMKCGVRKDGTLTDCTIVQEDPPGDGFGEAALASAKYFKMTLTTKAGTSVEGGVVIIPMRWLAP